MGIGISLCLYLRISDKQTNGVNRGTNRNSKTGIKGVSFYRDGRFLARITKVG